MLVQEQIKPILCGNPDISQHELFIQYLIDYYCDNVVESEIIRKVLWKAPSWNTVARIRCFMQNWINRVVPAKSEKYKKECNKQEDRIRDEYSPVHNLIQRIFKTFK